MMRGQAGRGARGLTLVELVVALGVSALTVAAGMALLIQQQRSYSVTSADRSQQEAGRLALQELLARLKHAGYGVDPNLAFDFGAVAQAPRTNLRAPATMVGVSTFKCNDPVRCRDRTDGADEIVFYSRDPWFRRVATAVTTTSLEVLGELKVPLYQGQILQVTCMGGSRTRAYVTVRTRVDAVPVPDPTRRVTIALEDGVQAAGREVFPRENAQLVDGCFSLGGPGSEVYVTAVDRYRYYVDWFLPDGGQAAPHADRARPYLMLDQGLSGLEGGPADAPILLPVAPDVEDLQFAYYYPPAVAGGPARVVGEILTINIADDLFRMRVDLLPPAMDDLLEAPPRLTSHPANIQAVRVGVVVRQPEADVSLRPEEGDFLPDAGNRPTRPGQPHHRRAYFETTVVLRNMQSTYFTYPVN